MRLSSGLRVSRAADDAAGIAVASGLNVDSRIFAQGLRNLSDGVSVTNIAEGALNELTNVVTRLQELAQQASNGTLGVRQRAALDAEAQALSKEYLRISKTTEFNGQKLFDGSVQSLSLQAGYGAAATLYTPLAGKMGTGTFDSKVDLGTTEPHNVSAGDVNGDGALDIVLTNYSSDTATVFLGNGDGTYKAQTNFATGDAPRFMALGDLNNDGTLDILSVNRGASSLSVFLGNGDGTFTRKADVSTTLSPFQCSLGDVNGDGTLDAVIANDLSGSATVLLGNGNGTFRSGAAFATAPNPLDISLADLNGDGALDIVTTSIAQSVASVLLGNGDGSFNARTNYQAGAQSRAVALADLNNDGFIDMVTGDSTDQTASVLMGNGDGSFRARSAYAVEHGPYAVKLGDFNGDGALDIVTANFLGNTASVLLGNGDGTFSGRLDLTTGGSPQAIALGDLNLDGVLDILTANDSGSVSVLRGQTRDGVAPLLSFSLKTKAEAKWALELFKQKLTHLSQQRGVIGANQSRLSTAVANLQVERENYEAASSQITDADVAQESAELLKTRILQQASAAVLGQANQAPALALRLIG